ncbi:MAG: hypothetical protein U1F42_05660 [Candidatus Competibacteraceae bacterium]
MPSPKILLLILILTGVAGVVAAVSNETHQESGAPVERIVHVTAHKFAYRPNEITLKRGNP